MLGVEVARARPTGRREHLEPHGLLRVAVDGREHRTVRAARHEGGVERVVRREDRGQVGSGRPERCVRGAHRFDEGRVAIGRGDGLAERDRLEREPQLVEVLGVPPGRGRHPRPPLREPLDETLGGEPTQGLPQRGRAHAVPIGEVGHHEGVEALGHARQNRAVAGLEGVAERLVRLGDLLQRATIVDALAELLGDALVRLIHGEVSLSLNRSAPFLRLDERR